MSNLQEYNSFDSELKIHSSALTNERIAALMALFDEAMIEANLDYKIEKSEKALVYLKQIWKNFRTLVRSNAYCRKDLNLDTIAEGVYLPDVIIRQIENVILQVKLGQKEETILTVLHLNRMIENIEIVIRDTIQYFKFTFRPDSRTKPDIHQATEMMLEMVDKQTEEELLEIVGVNNHVKWSQYAKEKIFESK